MDEQVTHADLNISRWYALFVRSHQERQVATHLSGLQLEHYLPCYSSVRQWKDRRVTLEMPLFPGYLFVRLPLQERMKVLTIRPVVALIGKKNAPTPISDCEIEGIRAGIEHGNAEPHDYLEAGQRIVITEGVMRGMEGILLAVRKRARVVISLQSIGRAFVVEVGEDCVRPLTERRTPPYEFISPMPSPVRGDAGDLERSQVLPVNAASPQSLIEGK
jgi:transcription antitermination factor NusG